jgi:AraC-like DNA-binding protein
MATDPLSDALRAVRLTGGVFLDARLTAPWCITAHMSAEDCQPFLIAPPTQLIAYHVVVTGSLLLWIDDEPPVEVRAGEVVVLPRNGRHLMASEPGLPVVSAGTLVEPPVNGGLARIVHGGGGAMTQMICGFLACEDGFNPLIASLPKVLTLDLQEGASRAWVEASVRFAANELVAGRIAPGGVVSRLSELLLVEAVRAYAARLVDAEIGWLKGLQDPQIGRALTLMHRDMAAPWSAETLASAVAMSRSAFMERFRSLVGMPPIRYLTLWRLQSARQLLRESGKSIAQLAHAVGYESEEAFSRAFKREFGVSPAHWREQSR